MLLKVINGLELHLPTSGGKAGRGNQKTTSLQLRKDGLIVKQFKFQIGSAESKQTAVTKAIRYATNYEDEVILEAVRLEALKSDVTIIGIYVAIVGPMGARRRIATTYTLDEAKQQPAGDYETLKVYSRVDVKSRGPWLCCFDVAGNRYADTVEKKVSNWKDS